MQTLKLYLHLGYRYWLYSLVSHCKLLPIDWRIVAELKCIAMLETYAKVKYNLNLKGDDECAT